MGKYRDKLAEAYKGGSNETKVTIARGLIARVSEQDAKEFLEDYNLFTEDG